MLFHTNLTLHASIPQWEGLIGQTVADGFFGHESHGAPTRPPKVLREPFATHAGKKTHTLSLSLCLSLPVHNTGTT